MGFTYHKNYVFVETLYGDDNGNIPNDPKDKDYSPWHITGGSFTITAFDVTKGQDPDHRLKVGAVHKMDKDHRFLFEFGRHGDSKVADSFNKQCPPARNTFNDEADKLNFWVKGTLVLTFHNGEKYTFPNTFFAQGHTGASNNWWFGNDGMTNSSVPILLYDPYATEGLPIPVYFGEECYGGISPEEDPNQVFKFQRGDGGMPNPKNTVQLVGVYSKEKYK